MMNRHTQPKTWTRRCRSLLPALAMGAALLPGSVLAHSGPPPVPANIWSTWNIDPLVIVVLLIGMVAYVRGVRAIWARVGRGRGLQRWQVAAAGSGFLLLAIALISPLDPLSTALFSAHMVQHMLLVAFAPVLLVLGNAGVPYLWSMPRSWRRSLTRTWGDATLARRLWGAIAQPIPVLLIHSLILWVWHAPPLYTAAIRIELIHGLEHLTMFGSAMLFWWVVIQRGRQSGLSYGLGLLMIFGVVIQKTALGALITFSPTLLYGEYAATTAAWGLTPIEDQQLAGAVMMAPWGVVYLIAGVTLFARWIRAIERRVDRDERLSAGALATGRAGNRQAKETV